MFNAHRAVWGLMREAGAGWEEVAHNLEKMEGVVSVFTVSGEVDLMLEIVTQDMQYYSRVVLQDVLNTKGVTATRSSFVLDEVKSLY